MNQQFFTLLALCITLLSYQLGLWIFKVSREKAFLHPVALAILFLVIILKSVGVSYQDYFHGSQILHFLLGPATISLAVPLYEQRKKIQAVIRPLTISLMIGSLCGILSSLLIAWFFHAHKIVLLSVASKSVTTPIAIGITEKIGGDISLAAIVVIFTGIFGAMLGLPFLRLFKLKNEDSLGFSMGVACHGIGTARALQESSEMGAFAGSAIALNGVVTCFLTPVIIHLWNF